MRIALYGRCCRLLKARAMKKTCTCTYIHTRHALTHTHLHTHGAGSPEANRGQEPGALLHTYHLHSPLAVPPDARPAA